jgi:hypothetical protein
MPRAKYKYWESEPERKREPDGTNGIQVNPGYRQDARSDSEQFDYDQQLVSKTGSTPLSSGATPVELEKPRVDCTSASVRAFALV